MAKAVIGNNVPLYKQIATKIKQDIRSGRYLSGENMPALRKLGGDYGVSLKVVQQAVALLRQDGAVVTHQGRGITVADAESCKKTSFLFGLIQPFSPAVAFGQQVVLYAEEAFDNRDNLMVIRSSKGIAAAERDIVEHLVHNGVQGILLWPVDHNPNAEYLERISKETPIVLIDRKLPNATSIPSVTLDMFGAGQDICRHFFQTLGRKRLLVLMDNLQISPDFDLIEGIQRKAMDLSRMADVTVTQLPISKFIRELNLSDYSSVETFRCTVAKLLINDQFDAVFCPQEEFLESVMIETGMVDQIKGIALGSMTGPVQTRGRKYNETGVFRWVWDFPKMISTAADLLQEWRLSGKRVAGNMQIHVHSWDTYGTS